MGAYVVPVMPVATVAKDPPSMLRATSKLFSPDEPTSAPVQLMFARSCVPDRVVLTRRATTGVDVVGGGRAIVGVITFEPAVGLPAMSVSEPSPIWTVSVPSAAARLSTVKLYDAPDP